jgi:SAM-dependent methyltransferase
MLSFLRRLFFVIVALGSFSRASALEVLAPSELKVALQGIAQTASSDLGTPVKASYYEDTLLAAREAISSTKADLFIAADEETFQAAQSAGLLVEPKGIVYYKRLSIAVQPKNPKMVFGLDDLAKPGLRIVIQPEGKTLLGNFTASVIEHSQERGKVPGTLIRQTSDPAEMVSQLRSGQADALLCWDTLEAQALGQMALMRLPWKVCPTQTCYGAVTRFASDKSLSAKVLEFVSSQKARDVLFAHGFWLESGRNGGEHMNRVATGPFAPMYPLLAKQIVDDYGIKEGICVDIGCGPGQLPIELAKITKLTIYGLDIEPQTLELARAHAGEAGIGGNRLRLVTGDALSLPFPDDFADLVVSRGTIPFLRDKAQGFREAYRILKPGGVAFMGGGFSRYQPAEQVEQMRRFAREHETDGPKACMKLDYPSILKAAGITRYRLIRDNGLWVEMRKQKKIQNSKSEARNKFQ